MWMCASCGVSMSGKTGEYTETDIPDEAKALFDRYYNELIESISATDDSLLEHYLEGGEISREGEEHAK